MNDPAERGCRHEVLKKLRGFDHQVTARYGHNMIAIRRGSRFKLVNAFSHGWYECVNKCGPTVAWPLSTPSRPAFDQ